MASYMDVETAKMDEMIYSIFGDVLYPEHQGLLHIVWTILLGAQGQVRNNNVFHKELCGNKEPDIFF